MARTVRGCPTAQLQPEGMEKPETNPTVSNVQSIREHIAEYKTDSRSVYDILDQIYKDTDLYPYVKQHKSKRDSRGAFYAIHFQW